MTYGLWIIQGILAVVFLVAGGSKLVMSAEAMTSQMKVPLPILLLRFVGVCEVLGAVGLILPGVLRTRQDLTPMAAGGLVVIMIGATAITAAGGDIALAFIPLGVGLLTAYVAYAHWRRTPHR
jgi:uncharacterized membrane protein YphA (DoxX/SURF4 family)